MATQIKEYGARVNGELYPCRLNHTIYSQGGVAAALGFEKPGADVNFNGVGDFRSLRRAGALIRVTATGTKGEGTNLQRKSFQLSSISPRINGKVPCR